MKPRKTTCNLHVLQKSGAVIWTNQEKILIGGIFAGALVYGLGEMNTFRLERKVHRASEGVCRRNGSRSEEASRFHSCAAFLGCGISFCGGFVNSAKLFSENSRTKTRAHERMPPRRVCLARPNERPALVGSSTVALSAQRARVDSREFRAKIQQQCGVIDPCDDQHQRAGGPVSGSRYTLPDVEPNEDHSQKTWTHHKAHGTLSRLCGPRFLPS